ncbi:MAG: hypothetical protein J0L89_06170 [Xanthomonadales bacterium]|nr:hypothetical protein [Xanthomonadales bacterium]
MNAAILPSHQPLPFATALRLVAAAGGWANALVVVGIAAGPALALLGGTDPGPAYLALTLAAMLTMFWAMLAGGRLLGICVTASALRLPHWRRPLLACACVAMGGVVLLPALVHALSSHIDLALAVSALAAGMAAGLLWTSMPPWTMFALIAAGVPASRLLVGIDDDAVAAVLLSPALLPGLTVLLLAAAALCWAWIGKRRGAMGTWSTPMAVAFARSGFASLDQAQQDSYNSRLFMQDTPVGSELRRHPQQALAIALGPGFGRSTFKSMLGTQGPIVAVALFWLLLGTGDGKVHVGLQFAPIMVMSVAFAPMIRLQSLFARPAMGLHELALLPGLPRNAAASLSGHMLRQAIGRGLPALAVMAGFGLAVGAPRPYYHLLLWIFAAGMLLLAASTLLSLHSRVARWGCGALMVALILAVLASMMVATGSKFTAPAWLLPAWSAATLAGAVLHGWALARLKALPHPWLAN